MNKSLRVLIISFLVFFSLLLYAFKINFSEKYPSDWDLIKVGMNMNQVHMTLPNINKNLKDIKGFESDGCDFGKSYWTLRVYYDDSEKVRLVEKEYIYKSFGLFNHKIILE